MYHIAIEGSLINSSRRHVIILLSVQDTNFLRRAPIQSTVSVQYQTKDYLTTYAPMAFEYCCRCAMFKLTWLRWRKVKKHESAIDHVHKQIPSLKCHGLALQCKASQRCRISILYPVQGHNDSCNRVSVFAIYGWQCSVATSHTIIRLPTDDRLSRQSHACVTTVFYTLSLRFLVQSPAR